MLLFLASGAALGALLGRSWPLLALSWRLLGRAWPSRGAPGSHFRHPGASFGTCLGLFFRRLWKNTKTLIFDDSCSENQGFGVPGGSKIEPRWLPNRSWARLGASWRSLGASRRCPWRLLAASWRSWGLLGASWAALVPILAQKENLAIMEREARSQRELQALQAANNKTAKHQESVLVKLRGRAPRPRSASWRGVAWNASRAGGLNASLQAEQNGTKMA